MMINKLMNTHVYLTSSIDKHNGLMPNTKTVSMHVIKHTIVMLLLPEMLTMDEGLVTYTWMMWNAVDLRADC